MAVSLCASDVRREWQPIRVRCTQQTIFLLFDKSDLRLFWPSCYSGPSVACVWQVLSMDSLSAFWPPGGEPVIIAAVRST